MASKVQTKVAPAAQGKAAQHQSPQKQQSPQKGQQQQSPQKGQKQHQREASPEPLPKSKTALFIPPREAEKGKSIRVYQNGDIKVPGHLIALNSRNTRSFDGALEILTQVLRPGFGAVRRLYTPQHGTVVNNLKEIEDGKDYVAAANEKFKYLEYRRIVSGHTRAMQKFQMPNKLESLPNFPRVVRSARAAKAGQEHPRSICVVRNGDTSGSGVRLVLGKRDAAYLDQVFEQINERIVLQSGALRKLYTFDGRPVETLDDIVDGGEYVACGRQPFVKAAYTSQNIGVGPSTRKLPRMLPGTTSMPTYLEKSPTRAYTEPVVSKKHEESPTLKRKPASTVAAASPTKAKSEVQAKKKPVDDDDDDRNGSPRKAKEEAKPAKKAPLKPEQKVQGYNVSVVTGNQDYAGTTANVYLTIVGSKTSSGKRKLNDTDPHFEKGETDVFALEAPELGDLTKIKLEHDGSGPSSSWYVEKVVIRDVISNKKYYFHVNNWLADDRGEMKTSIEVPASSDPSPPKQKAPEKKEEGFFSKLAHAAADIIDDTFDTNEDEPIDRKKAAKVDDDDDDDDDKRQAKARAAKKAKSPEPDDDKDDDKPKKIIPKKPVKADNDSDDDDDKPKKASPSKKAKNSDSDDEKDDDDDDKPKKASPKKPVKADNDSDDDDDKPKKASPSKKAKNSDSDDEKDDDDDDDKPKKASPKKKKNVDDFDDGNHESNADE